MGLRKHVENNNAFRIIAGVTRGALVHASVVIVSIFVLGTMIAASDYRNNTQLQPSVKAQVTQQSSGDSPLDRMHSYKMNLPNARMTSNHPADDAKTSSGEAPPITEPQGLQEPDYTSLSLIIESIQKGTVYVNGQPKTVYNTFGQVMYPYGPSSGTVGNGDCTLRLIKLGRGAVGDFTLTTESQANSYGPTCQFQPAVSRSQLTAGSWLAIMTYTTPDGLGEAEHYKGFTVD